MNQNDSDNVSETEIQQTQTADKSGPGEAGTSVQETGQEAETDKQAESGLYDKAGEEKIEQYLKSMTLEEKVAQLFVVLPESLIDGVDCVTAAGETTRKAISDIPVGGFILKLPITECSRR